MRLSDPFRQTFTTAFDESSNPVRLFSGLRARKGKDAPTERSLFIGAFGDNPQAEAGSSFKIRLSGSRFGAHYERTFHLAVGETAVFDGCGMEDMSGEVLAYAGTNDVQLVAGFGSPDPAASEIRPLLLYQAFTGSPTLERVPFGAREVIGYAANPDFTWHLYDGTNTRRDLGEAVGAGDRTSVKGTHFTGSANGAVAWVIYP